MQIKKKNGSPAQLTLADRFTLPKAPDENNSLKSLSFDKTISRAALIEELKAVVKDPDKEKMETLLNRIRKLHAYDSLNPVALRAIREK